MTNINSLNYLAFGIKGNKQLGSNKVAAENKLDLTDGLSEDELKLIDKNKDGAISEEEYKQTFGGQGDSYKTYWEALTTFYNSKCKNNKNGATETSQVNDVTVTSTYGANGTLKSYTETTVDAEGVKTVVSYTVKNGKAVKTKTTKINADGTQSILNNETNVSTTKSIDGTAISTNQNGNLITLATADGSTKINFGYDKNGKIAKATVVINGKKYTGAKVSTSKDGKTTTIKNSDGKIIAKYHTNEKGETFITAYKDGVKAKCFKLDDNNEPVYVNTYATSGNNKGKITQREYCDTGITRKFKRNSKGKLTSSTDYKDGIKTSLQTYNADNKFTTRTFYDSEGNVTAYQEYSYTKNSKGVVTSRTINRYADNSKSELIATYRDTLDKDGNKLTRIIDRPNSYSETIEYQYNDKNELVKTISNKGNVLKETDYENGRKIKESKTTIEDGKSTNQVTEFDYYGDTDVVQYKTISKDDGSVVQYEYSKEGELVSQNVLQEPTAPETNPDVSTGTTEGPTTGTTENPTESPYKEQIDALYEQYLQATTTEEKDKISAQIMHLQSLGYAEKAEKEGRQNIADIYYEMAELYSQMINATNEDFQRDNLLDQIRVLECEKNAIIATENGDLKEAQYQRELAEVYEELSLTQDADVRRQINGSISSLENTRRAEIETENGNYVEAGFSKEIAELYSELSQTSDRETQNKISSKISSLEAQKEAYIQVQNGDVELANMNQEIAGLYDQMANVTTDEENFQIFCKIKEATSLKNALIAERNNNMELVNKYRQLAQLYVQLANAISPEERNEISQQIMELSNTI